MVLVYVFVVIVGLYTALAAVFDLRLHRIPNYLTVPAALLGLAYHALLPGGWGILTSLAGFALGFLFLLLPWILGGGGMGDVKLLAALGAWLGPAHVAIAFALSVFLAAMIAVGIMIRHAFTQGVSATQRKYLSRGKRNNPHRSQGPVRVLPFAVPVAMSTWGVLAWMLVRGNL